MCIILTCDRNIRPKRDLIERCFEHNPDGAGIMWIESGTVQISKGYMRSSELVYAIERVPMDSPLIIHMRIATSGGIDIGTCHPFPICDDLNALHASDVECAAAIAHNGIIYGMHTDDKHGISDTIAFVAGRVNGMWRADNRVTRGMKQRMRDMAPHNRFAILTCDGTVYRIGDGWNSVTYGIQASNGTWRKPSWIDYLIDEPLDDDEPLSFYDCELDGWCADCECYDFCKRYGAMCDTAHRGWY